MVLGGVGVVVMGLVVGRRDMGRDEFWFGGFCLIFAFVFAFWTHINPHLTSPNPSLTRHPVHPQPPPNSDSDTNRNSDL